MITLVLILLAPLIIAFIFLWFNAHKLIKKLEQEEMETQDTEKLQQELEYWKARSAAAEKCVEAQGYEAELNPAFRSMVYDKGTYQRALKQLVKLKSNEP